MVPFLQHGDTFDLDIRVQWQCFDRDATDWSQQFDWGKVEKLSHVLAGLTSPQYCI